MNCLVLDHKGLPQTQATFKDICHADDGTAWAALQNDQGQDFYISLERVRDLEGKPVGPSSVLPHARQYTSEEDEIFVATVMEFLASGAETIAEFNALDPAHRRCNAKRN